jgi:beta-phosphoglucomutase-like phosphatase (HAD superfamily)
LNVLVLAFDGVLFDTLEARSACVSDSLAAEGLTVDNAMLQQAIAGRSLAEAVRFLAQRSARSATARALDETTVDVATMRADQAYADLAARGFAVNVSARAMLERASSISRIVLRADSRRREVDALLSLAGLDLAFAMTRCSDDPAPRPVTNAVAMLGHMERGAFNGSIERSYAGIRLRLAANSRLMGERVIGIALEASSLARETAASAGFDTPENIASVHFPGS